MRVLAATLLALVFYVAATATLVGSLYAGTVWLSSRDPSLATPVRAAAPIPPRIAESLTAAFIPEKPPQPVAPRTPMIEANVSLTDPAEVQDSGALAARKKAEEEAG